MEYGYLGQSGLRVSRLALGTMTFGRSGAGAPSVASSNDDAKAVLDRALDAGINLIDTANIYNKGESERLLGAWLREKRKDVVLATKCRFPTGEGSNDQGLSRQHIIEACEASLRRLNTDHIDLFQTHMQDTHVPVEETMRALDDLVRSGKVRYAGCSNYTGYRLVESLWASDRGGFSRYASVQLEYSLVCRGAEREVVPAAKAHGLGVLAYSPLGRGFLTGKYTAGDAPPPGSRLEAWTDSWKALANSDNFALVEVVRDIARDHATTPAVVSLAWALTRPFLTSLILGARNVDQLSSNLAALSLRLSAEETARLDDLSIPSWGYPYAFIGARQEW